MYDIMRIRDFSPKNISLHPLNLKLHYLYYQSAFLPNFVMESWKKY